MSDDEASDLDIPKGKQANGHRPVGLLPSIFAPGLDSPAADIGDLPFDVDSRLAAVVRLTSTIPEDTYSAPLLGTEREGSAILLDEEGLALTIGYLVLEARTVMLENEHGVPVPAEIVAYDYDTGFGLVRAIEPLGLPAMPVGRSADLEERDTVLVAAHGGRAAAVAAEVVSRRPFAGYWEYMLDEAIFTAPPHPNWGGAALIGMDGRLQGLGSLYVEDARPSAPGSKGNMFVPIDLLRPIFGDLLRNGKSEDPPNPWLGMFTAEAMGQLHVVHLADGGPAQKAGIKDGDVVLKVAGAMVSDLIDFYRRLWSQGPAGTAVTLTMLRESTAFEITITSAARSDFMRMQER